MAEAAPAVEAIPEKKGSMMLVAIVAAIVAAGAAGGGVYFFAGGEPGAIPADAAKETAAPKVPAIYVKFDPPFVVNFEAKGMMRFLQVSVEIATHDAVTADLIKQHDPVLRNDLLMLLGSQTYATISTREGKEQLRKEALEAVAKIVASEGGDGKHVEQLYFTSFVMQ